MNFCFTDYSHNTEKENKHLSSKRNNMKETEFEIIRLPCNEVIRTPSCRDGMLTISPQKNPHTDPTKIKQKPTKSTLAKLRGLFYEPCHAPDLRTMVLKPGATEYLNNTGGISVHEKKI